MFSLLRELEQDPATPKARQVATVTLKAEGRKDRRQQRLAV